MIEFFKNDENDKANAIKIINTITIINNLTEKFISKLPRFWNF